MGWKRSSAVGLIAALPLTGLAASGPEAAQDARSLPPDLQRGRYVIATSGCNDCHTPGYFESGGRVPDDKWLVGTALGWHGPWGTTYPSNLRLIASQMTEDQWLHHARNEWRPPMPWFSLRAMSDDDVRAIYRYLRHLGPAGEPAPAHVPPGKEPAQPYVAFPSPPPQ